jgi:two-component system sensor histidine kinase KdpD
VSRIQAGVLQPRCTVAPLADLVTTVVADLAAALRGHAVRVDVPSSLPPVDVNLVLISRVLTSLLENAVRHGPKNTPSRSRPR